MQFVVVLGLSVALILSKDCQYPKKVLIISIPQSLFMIALFGDFYIRNYILPKKKADVNGKF